MKRKSRMTALTIAIALLMTVCSAFIVQFPGFPSAAADSRRIPSTTKEFAAELEVHSDALEMEKFEDYCYMRKPNKFSKDFRMNDIYYFGSLLYSIWTGRCYQKDFDDTMAENMALELERAGLDGSSLLEMLRLNLGEDACYHESANLEHMLDALDQMKKTG